MKCQRPSCTRRAVVEVRLYEADKTTTDIILCGPDAEEVAGQYPDNIRKLKDVR